MRIRIFIGLLVALTLSGCQSASVVEHHAPVYGSPLPTYWPGETAPSPIVEEVNVFALSDVQTQTFLDYFQAPQHSHRQPHWRLADFLETRLDNFDYRGSTYTAQQAMTRNSGNCLSLALMTGALAEAAGLKIDYQWVDTAPVFRLETGLLIVSRHVRSKVYDPDFIPEKQTIYLSKPAVLIDYLPRPGDRYGKHVTKEDVIAMYYQNLASDALIDNDLDKAHSLIRLALTHNELNPASLTILAVIYNRAGQELLAEQVYLYALEREITSLELLANYRQLLIKQGRQSDAAQVAEKIGRDDDSNPYRWVEIAEQSFNEEEYGAAMSYYRKAEQIAPYLEEIHLGFAKVFFRQGKLESAGKALEKAIKLSYRAKEKRLYEAKLATLRASYSEAESAAN